MFLLWQVDEKKKWGKLYHMTRRLSGGLALLQAFKSVPILEPSKPWLIICLSHCRHDIGSKTETGNHEGISLLAHYSALMIEQWSYSASRRKPSCLDRAINIKTHTGAGCERSSWLLLGPLLWWALHQPHNRPMPCRSLCWQSDKRTACMN